jgi:polyvinyl alcohol dehydrogenase (cytochrome)
LYVTTGDNYSIPATATSDAVLALDLDNGKIVWSRQFTEGDVFNLACAFRRDPTCKEEAGPDFDFGSSPILVTLAGGKRSLILGQKSGMIYAIDPDRRGELLWQARAGKGGALGGIQWGPATDGRTIFAAVSDIAFLPSTEPGKMNTDPNTGGGLVAYTVDSGREQWRAKPMPCGDRRPCSPAQSAAVTAIPGVVFSGSLDGHIRAYSTADGKLLWDFDTERSFNTVNGVAASGGSLDAAGAVVAEGMVFVVSGYPTNGGKPGNVLLAFAAE